MQRVKGLLKASHFGPTLLVTAISFGFATYYWWEGPAYVIAFGVFTGQLVVGWSNDLYDFEDDLKHNRQNKPLVSGVITREFLQRCLRLMVAWFTCLVLPVELHITSTLNSQFSPLCHLLLPSLRFHHVLQFQKT
jgi:4-hydroxybenzoate polyprenyltransferase